ncbi:hypothetical protein PspLS_03210 [Pyricularia sp. CBS 133598]|nr:hypothetical protein PspLS_03210 [Pyricularia sp. CBS 133598]
MLNSYPLPAHGRGPVDVYRYRPQPVLKRPKPESQHMAMNTWELAALHAAEEEHRASQHGPSRHHQRQDSLIYPGLYSHSGINMLDILFRIAARPNPQIDLGPIDSSCAMILCDLALPDTPIVYATNPFLELTGYSNEEVIGRNCRFLQAPPDNGSVRQGSTRQHVSKNLVQDMRRSVDANYEIQLEVPNFRKDGTCFTNILTMIPIRWDGADYRYSVGFQCEKEC